VATRNRSFMTSASESSLVRDFEASFPEAARRHEASNDIRYFMRLPEV
jgi:hypothetical protein